MSVSLQKHKSQLNEVMLQDEDRRDFMNPISKTTFEALPRIYGRRKKKKYVLKYNIDDRPQRDLATNRDYPHHHCPPPDPIAPRPTLPADSNKRFKTEMKCYDRQSAQKLSKPRGETCNRRYCFCNKDHNEARSDNKSFSKGKALRANSIRLPQLEKAEPDDIESKHKVAMATLEPKDAAATGSPFSLLELLRNTHRQETFRRPALIQQPQLRSSRNVQHAMSVEVQTEDFYQGQNRSDDQIRMEGVTEPMEKAVRTGRRTASAAKESKEAYSVAIKNKNEEEKAKEKNQQEAVDDNDQHSVGEDQQSDYQNGESPKARMQRLKAEQMAAIKQVQSDSDDNQSVISSISSASLSRYVFEGGKKTNTMFHSLKNKETSSQKDSPPKKPKDPSQKYTYQKKNGLFIIPEDEQFVSFLKDYEPMGDNFTVKNLVRKSKFKVVKSDEGVYFGEVNSEQRSGKGIMVTQRTIFEGSYQDDLKIYGCERNIDGVYKGQFVNGLRQGFGTFEWNNGQVFQGEWRKGTKNGYGTWRSPKGDFYEGEWLLNRQHGKGTYRHRLSTYRGHFKEFLKHGHGEELFSNGDRYKGDYKSGKPHGKGRYEWADGGYYQGDFVEGVRQGRGKWVYNNGTVYEGEFKRDFKEGEGRERYKSGEYYEGVFKEGSKYEGVLYDLNKNAIRIRPPDT